MSYLGHTVPTVATAAERDAYRAYRDAADMAFAAHRNYDARRAQRGTWTTTLERARAEWGLAEITRIDALLAWAAAEDAEWFGRAA